MYHASKLRLLGIKPRIYWEREAGVWICDLKHVNPDTVTPIGWGVTHELAYHAWAQGLDVMYGVPEVHEAPRALQ
jgi:hypothetical protein